MSAGEDCCDNQDEKNKNKNKNKILVDLRLFFVLIILLFLIFFLIIWLVTLIFPIPGAEPKIILHDVKVYDFKFSTATSTLTSTFQVTIFGQNTYHETGIHFDEMNVYASYRNQPITASTSIPPTYVGNQDVTEWSPYLNGTVVPVGPDLAASLVEDVTAGGVLINVIATGRLRSKGDLFGTYHYRLKVNCPAYVMFWNKTDGSSAVVKPPFADECYTHVEV